MKQLLIFLYDEFNSMSFHYKLKIYISFFVLIIGCSLSGFVQIIFKNILNILAAPSSKSYFFLIAIFFLYSFSWMINQITNIIVWFIVQKGLVEFSKKIIIKSFAYVLSIPYQSIILEKNKTILMYLESIFATIQSVFSSFIIHILPALVEMIIAFAFFTIFYGWVYSVILLLLMIVFFYITYYFIHSNKVLEEEYYKEYDFFKEHINNVLGHIEIIKIYNANQYECSVLYKVLKSFFDISYRRNLVLDRAQIYQVLFCGFTLFFFTLFSFWQYKNGVLSIADFILINNYFLQFSIPMTFLGYIFSDLYKNFVVLNKAYAIFSFDQDKKKDLVSGSYISYSDENIIFDKVDLLIRENVVLSELSFSIKKGAKIALVGKSGSGKSTILKLLCGLIHSSAGNIFIDSMNIKDLSFFQIAKLITYIPQQSYLFLGTIRENLIYNNSNNDILNNQKIVIALEKFKLLDKINKLEKGINTDINQTSFSGGEKQRLSIIRGILRNSPIFLLDEITASLDSENELFVSDYLDELLIEKTVISVTHRMHNIDQFDTILVLEKGKLVGIGTHENLLKENKYYQNLYS